MTVSSHLKLPFIDPAQAGKHITHNEALAALDTLTQLAVLDRDLNAPPASPAPGARYIVGPAPTGEWAGKVAHIATHDGVAWLFHVPEPGWLAFVLDENGLLVWNGSAWLPTAGIGGRLGINASADATNRLAVKSDAVLLGHDDVTPGSGDMRLKLNKAAGARTASLLLQTAASGRAEIGTAGDDKLHFKVSPDGSAWTDALVIDGAGAVGIGTDAPEGPLHIRRTTANLVHERIDNTPSGPSFIHRKARGTPTTPAAVQNGDTIMPFLGFAWDGTNWQACGVLRWTVDGPVTGGEVPTRVEIHTRASGASSWNEKMRIDSAGNVGIGITSPAVKLDVDGPVRVRSYTVAGLPLPTAAGQLVLVANESGGAVMAFSDGVAWRRVTDRAVVS